MTWGGDGHIAHRTCTYSKVGMYRDWHRGRRKEGGGVDGNAHKNRAHVQRQRPAAVAVAVSPHPDARTQLYRSILPPAPLFLLAIADEPPKGLSASNPSSGTRGPLIWTHAGWECIFRSNLHEEKSIRGRINLKFNPDGLEASPSGPRSGNTSSPIGIHVLRSPRPSIPSASKTRNRSCLSGVISIAIEFLLYSR